MKHDEVFAKLDQLIKKKEFQKAKALIFRQLKRYPDDIWLLRQLVFVYHELGNFQKCWECADKVHKLSPDNPYVLWYYALINEEFHGRERRAVLAYKKIIRLDSSCFQERLPNRRRATSAYIQSFKMDCKFRLAMTYLDLYDNENVIYYLKEFLHDREKGIKSHYSVKRAKDHLWLCENRHVLEDLLIEEDNKKSLRKAQKMLLKAVKIDPGFWYYAELSWTCQVLNDPVNALKYSQIALNLAPNAPLVNLHHAFALQANEQFEQSTKYFKKLLRKGAKRIGYEETKMGVRWARHILHEARYSIAFN